MTTTKKQSSENSIDHDPNITTSKKFQTETILLIWTKIRFRMELDSRGTNKIHPVQPGSKKKLKKEQIVILSMKELNGERKI